MIAAWFDAPTAGEAPDLAPHDLGPTQATRLRNFLVDNPGRIIPRGKIGGPVALTDTGSLVDTTNGGAMVVAFQFEDSVSVAYRAPSAGPKVDYWRVPINRPATAGELSASSTGATAGRGVDLATGAITNTNVTAATSIPGPSIVNVDNGFYAVSFSGASTAVPIGVAPLNLIRKADVAGSAAVLTNGPGHVQQVFSHAGRLWAAAARSPGGAATPGGFNYDTSRILYTIPGGTTAFTNVVSDWQDPVTGELNTFAIGPANDGDFVVGFGRAAGHLIVFKRRSVWVLYGTVPANFTLRQLRTQSGCVDFRSIVVSEEGTYFASQLGYELFDGSNFRLLTDPINETWLALSNAGVAAGTVNHAFIRADSLPNGYLHVALGTDSTVANADDGTQRAWFLHRATGAWIDVRSNIATLKLGASGFINRFVTTRSHVVAFGAAKWARADLVTYGAEDVVDADSGAAYNVDLIWQTRVEDLGAYRELDARWQTHTLERTAASYRHRYTGSPPADLTPFGTLAAADGSGANVFVPTLDLPGYTPPGPARARPVFSTPYELDRGDLSLTLASSLGSDPALRTAALSVYGAGVGFNDGKRERYVA